MKELLGSANRLAGTGFGFEVVASGGVIVMSVAIDELKKRRG